jgi:hypothetical protein
MKYCYWIFKTDKAIVKRKKSKGQTIIYKTLHSKTKDPATRTKGIALTTSHQQQFKN